MSKTTKPAPNAVRSYYAHLPRLGGRTLRDMLAVQESEGRKIRDGGGSRTTPQRTAAKLFKLGLLWVWLDLHDMSRCCVLTDEALEHPDFVEALWKGAEQPHTQVYP